MVTKAWSKCFTYGYRIAPIIPEVGRFLFIVLPTGESSGSDALQIWSTDSPRIGCLDFCGTMSESSTENRTDREEE